ncbi:MAG: Gfo/Idh/MocA family oxidoreductase [Spirochaetia bacterium]
MNEGKTINLGIIGCGQRLRTLCSHLLQYEGIQVVSVYDPSPIQIDRFVEECGISPTVKRAADLQVIVEDREVKWLSIGSPNSFHFEHTKAALQAGKHVFLEKPLTTTIEDCIALAELKKKFGKHIITGFVLRYSPLYRKMKQLLQEEEFGQILTMQANENVSYEHAAYIMRGWRRKKELAGPHILEKCIHDIDILQWMAGSRFKRVAATGGRLIFSPLHQGLYSRDILSAWEEKGNLDSSDPFSDMQLSIEDHIQLIGECENGVKLQFSAVAGTAVPERRLSIHCVRGSLTGELYSGTLRYRTIDMDHEVELKWFGGGLHGGGDSVLSGELYAVMTGVGLPAVELEEGIWANIASLAADEAKRKEKWIDLGPYWHSLDQNQ